MEALGKVPVVPAGRPRNRHVTLLPRDGKAHVSNTINPS